MSSLSGEIELLSFNINDTVCGMTILDIQEVTKISDITPTPRAPEYVEGIINLRGNIVTIVNLGKKLGLVPVEKKKENQVIIINSDKEHIGLMISEINSVIHTTAAEIEPAPSNMNGIQAYYFKGVLKKENQLVGILETRKVLNPHVER